MKTQPELVDLFAMFAMMGQMGDTPRMGDDEHQRLIAERAYRMAVHMVYMRERFVGGVHE
jgi:hypothetical protein